MTALSRYASEFAALRKAPLPGSSLTLNRYPNKPLLLLSILDLIATGWFDENRLWLSPELNATFDRYWDIAAPRVETRNLRMPFEKLSSSPFWHLTDERHPWTRGRIAHLDPKLFALAADASSRAVLQSVLIEAHFAQEIHDLLRRATQTNEEAFRLSDALLRKVDVVRDAPAEAVRSQAFRITVVRAYDYRCAICGVRIVSPDGRTAAEAAHIHPWSLSRDDHPTNGLSLCRLCHWSFDAGLLAVSDAYLVLTSGRLVQNGNLGGHLITTAGRPIFVPQEERLMPSREKLRWHREKLFVR